MATLPNPLPKLAADPSGSSFGLELPPGRLIDVTAEGPSDEPLLWCADAPARPGDYDALRPARRAAGLLPLLVDMDGGQGGPETWELSPDEMSYPGDHDADEVLEEFWEEYTEEGDEWPGLAEPLTLAADPDERAAEVADSLADGRPGFKAPHLALVPARRSADIPAAIGWMGPANQEDDTARLCAVLRSWEDRFGVRLVALGHDWLTVSVAAPPADLDEAGEVAAEHFAFCPDDIGDLETYAQKLIGQPTWHFWWD
ncbi:DUF4253 domain-containing protein [Streptomyces sp. NPDC088350]|uniref:DUF4253 domain-containing protein n=1 Tax=Streptomyces sp. NPDC088350 TaxID=3365854 RepID=UPI0037FD02F9